MKPNRAIDTTAFAVPACEFTATDAVSAFGTSGAVTAAQFVFVEP